MTTGTETAFTSLTVAGLGGDTAAAIITEHLDAQPRLDVRRIGGSRILVTRTRRPRSAVIACIATVWLGGLGLLFLLVRRTDAAEIGIHEAPRGCTITLPPILGPAVVSELGRLLRPPEPAPRPTVDFTTDTTTDDASGVGDPIADLDVRTVPR